MNKLFIFVFLFSVSLNAADNQEAAKLEKMETGCMVRYSISKLNSFVTCTQNKVNGEIFCKVKSEKFPIYIETSEESNKQTFEALKTSYESLK